MCPKRAKLKNNVVAFRAVDVMDMVNAPNSLVIAAEQDDPKNPAEAKSTNTHSLRIMVQDNTTSACCTACC